MANQTTLVSENLAPLGLENIGSAAQPAFLYAGKQIWFFVPNHSVKEGTLFASRFAGLTELTGDQVLEAVSGKASLTTESVDSVKLVYPEHSLTLKQQQKLVKALVDNTPFENILIVTSSPLILTDAHNPVVLSKAIVTALPSEIDYLWENTPLNFGTDMGEIVHGLVGCPSTGALAQSRFDEITAMPASEEALELLQEGLLSCGPGYQRLRLASRMYDICQELNIDIKANADERRNRVHNRFGAKNLAGRRFGKA